MKIDLNREAQQIRRPMGMPQPQFRAEQKIERAVQQPRPASPKRDFPVPKILDWVITGVVYLLTFLVPIFFLSIVPSTLELNKQMLVVFLGGIAFLAWIGKLAWEGRIRIKKNFLLIPVLLFLIGF